MTGTEPSAASGGTNRNTVPAKPQSTRAPGPGSIRPLTVSSEPTPSTRRPRVCSASSISSVSRLRSAPEMVDAPRPCAAASAASTSARLVCDFEPGTVTVARTRVGAVGAGHVFTASSCRVGGCRGYQAP